MSEKISLKKAEQKTFRTAFQDGLWDVLIGFIIMMFGVAPLLSNRLGDFWSSMIFLPVWALVYLAIWLVRKFMILPRVGNVTFRATRKVRLVKFSIAMVIMNVLALALGLLSLSYFRTIPGFVNLITFGIILIIGFGIAAYFLDFPRLYLYGLLLAACLPIGELLYQNGMAGHHGFPITFGTVSVIMILTGLVIFFQTLRNNPVPAMDKPQKEV